jgi:DNA-binding MarR family transcriptional regulator
MKHLGSETDRPTAQIVQVAWHVLRIVRGAVDQTQTPGLSLTELRALGALAAAPGASLSEVADELGLQNPTASKTVETLVQQGLVVREVVPGNRRKQALYLTARGAEALDAAAGVAFTAIDDLLARLTPADRETVERAMALLHPLVHATDAHDRDMTHEPKTLGRSHVA